MQNTLNTQKSIFSNESVLAHSEVASAKKADALGKHTKFCATQTQQGFDEKQVKQKYKKLRYKTHSIIQKIMSYAHGVNRVCNCQKKRIDSNLSVGVSYNKTHKTASYSNLQLCGSHWICPICSETHANARKEELQRLLVLLAKHRIYAHMLTLTVPHRLGDSLEDTLSKLSKAKSELFKKGLSEFENIGHITSVEVKYSAENGWHPHLHLIVFTKQSYAEQEIKGTLGSMLNGVGVLGYQQKIAMRWQECCEKFGLRKPSLRHGVDLKRGYDDDETSHANELVNYILKEQLANEMTKGHTKNGKFNTDSLTPFELALLAEGEEEDGCFAVLFREYAKAIKGKNQAKKSPKLVAFLKSIEEQEEVENDESLEELEPPKLVYELTEKEWRLLCADHERRGKFLVLIEQDIYDCGIDTQKFPKADSFLNLLFRGRGEEFPPLMNF